MGFGKVAVVCVAIVLGCWLFGSSNTASEDLAAEDAKVSYEKDIVPILKDNCYSCHNAKKKKARVDLQSGYNGVAKIVTAEKPDDSRLFKCLIGKGAKQMPPKRMLAEETIAKVKSWIAEGAKNN